MPNTRANGLTLEYEIFGQADGVFKIRISQASLEKSGVRCETRG